MRRCSLAVLGRGRSWAACGPRPSFGARPLAGASRPRCQTPATPPRPQGPARVPDRARLLDATHPEKEAAAPDTALSRWDQIKLALVPYRVGLRKFGNNLRVVYNLLAHSVTHLDHRLTRRERRLVLLTVLDIAKLLPFAVVAAAPGGTLLLPVLARVFPSSLPTTFNMPSRDKLQETYKLSAQESLIQDQMNRQVKVAVKSLVDSMHANQVRENRQLHALIEHAVSGRPELLPSARAADSEQLLYSSFSDDDLLDVLNVDQLAALSAYFNRGSSGFLARYASDGYRFSILRYDLSKHLRRVTSEDVLLAQEGPTSLSEPDLLEACLQRGLVSPSDSLPAPAQVSRLQLWLYSTVGRHVPAVLVAFANMPARDADPEQHP